MVCVCVCCAHTCALTRVDEHWHPVISFSLQNVCRWYEESRFVCACLRDFSQLQLPLKSFFFSSSCFQIPPLEGTGVCVLPIGLSPPVVQD